MESIFYLPILKSKLGEFTALSKLSLRQKKLIAPVFEITPLEWDHAERKKPKTWEHHLDSFCKKFISKWGRDDCFIDTRLLNWEKSDNTSRIKYVFENLATAGLFPSPVVSLNSSDSFLRVLKFVLKKNSIREIGFRVSLNDVTNPDLKKYIVELLTDIKIAPKNTHLIFDLGEPNFSEPEDFSEGILAILEDFPFLAEWKSFTLAGASFPSSSAIKEGMTAFNRGEWLFYKLLISKILKTDYNRLINYGDYSIVNPTYFEFDPKIMSASANIRYTHDEKWIVAKGKALKSKTAYLQYIALAGNIVKSKFFFGEKFSDGDSHLAQCVRKEKGPGSPSVWMWVGNNHHFTKVLQDLFSSPRDF